MANPPSCGPEPLVRIPKKQAVLAVRHHGSSLRMGEAGNELFPVHAEDELVDDSCRELNFH